MAVTAASLIQMVRDDLDEQTAAHYSDAMIIRWLNRAQYDIANGMPQEKINLLPGLIASATGASISVALPGDFLRVIKLTLDGVASPVITPDDWLMDTGRPLKSLDSYGYILDGEINFGSSATYVLYYLKMPTSLTLLSTSMDYPDSFAHPLTLFAAGLGLIQDKWVQQGTELVTLFEKAMQNILSMPWMSVEGGTDDTK